MARRLMTGFLALMLAALLVGCSGFSFQDVNELLRAPALGQGQDEIQKALVAYLKDIEPQYKFPKEGDWRSPLIRGDLDGDGVDEAVLLYSVADSSSAANQERGNYVYIAVLRRVDGAWTVIQDVRGLASDIASVEMADLLGNGSKQLIIGFSSSNLKTLGLYMLVGEELKTVHQFEYSRYEIGDFTGRGGSDLIVVSRETDLSLWYVPTSGGEFLPDVESVRLYNNFLTCMNIVPSTGPDGEQLLVVDAILSHEDGNLASGVVFYSDGRFFTVDDSGAMQVATDRENRLLLSRDIDLDGVAEIPLRVGKNAISTPMGDKRLEYVQWVDFTDIDAGEQVKEFGLLDSDRSVYVRLPMEWREKIAAGGELLVGDGEGKGEWVIKRRKNEQELVSLRIVEAGETVPPGAVRVPGSVSSYLVLSMRLSEEETKAITMTLMN